MSVRVMQAVWEHSKQSGGALVLLLAIADNAHDDGGGAYPSNATLAQKARMTGRNVNILLKSLVDAGEIAIDAGAGPHGCNVYRVLLPGLATPENISPLKTFHPEKSDTEGVKKTARGGEASFRGGVKPVSPKPSVNHQENHPKEPSEQKPRAIRPSIESYQPTDELLDGLANERPDLNLDAVMENWRDYHREKGTVIKDFNASLRRWVRNERVQVNAPAVRATHTTGRAPGRPTVDPGDSLAYLKQRRGAV